MLELNTYEDPLLLN